MGFAEGGEIEPEEGPIGTSLEDFGADIDHRERETQVEQASASEFGVDDRPEVRTSDFPTRDSPVLGEFAKPLIG
jgi:hypothetical protein